MTASIVWLVACYAPNPQPGAPCANGACPEGLVCVLATGTCELTTDAALPATVDADGDADAPVLVDTTWVATGAMEEARWPKLRISFWICERLPGTAHRS